MYLVKAFVSVTLVVYSFVDVGVLKHNSDQQAQSPKKKKNYYHIRFNIYDYECM